MSSASVPRTPLEIVFDVFRLALHPLLPPGRRVRRVERLYHLNIGKRTTKIETLQFASQIASFNQGAIIEYVFVLAEKHKKLRLSLEKNHPELKENLNDLLKTMNRGFFEAVQGNFEFLHRHFDGRSSQTPRIAIMGNWRTEDKDKVIIIFRDTSVNYTNVFPLEESSALTHCARTGSPFICNDIVWATLTAGFRNPRISSSSVQRVANAGNMRTRYKKLSKNWSKVWTSGEDAKGRYRSTMVLPISIDSWRLNDEMIKRFRAEDASRLIFGYLCIDHVERDYFDKDIDIPIARMVCDIISIFAFQRLRFTNYSSTFASAEEFVDNHDYSEMLRGSLQDVIDAVSRTGTEFAESNVGSTVLLDTDEILLRTVEDEAFVVARDDRVQSGE